MPVHVSLATALDKGRLFSQVVYVALLEIDILDPVSRAVIETLRLAHNNEDFVFLGNTYIQMPFDFQVTTAKNELPSVTLAITDHTQAIQGRLQEYQGGVDSPVRLLIVSTANSDSAEITESFTITGARSKSSDYMVSFDLGVENPLALRFPARLMNRDRCPWRFRGTECAYTGAAPTCDFTLGGANGCRVKGNSVNFGGFPGIRRHSYR